MRETDSNALIAASARFRSLRRLSSPYLKIYPSNAAEVLETLERLRELL